MLKLQFNTSIDFIKQFAHRTQVYVLRKQFKILLENYSEAYQQVVEFANKLGVFFEPDSAHPQDLINAILHISNNQRAPSAYA